jgi:hypothetical protein
LADPADPNNFFYLLTPEGDILFNSRADLGLDTFVTHVINDSFTFNICLPTRKYMFVVIDGPMDGMEDVAYRLFVDGKKVKDNSGDFDSFAGYLVQPTSDPEYTHPGNAMLAERPGTAYECPYGYSVLVATIDYAGAKGDSYFFVLNSEGESVFDPFFDNINAEARPFDDTVAICLEDGDAYTAVHWYDSYASFSGQYKLFLNDHEIHSINGFDHEMVNGFLVETRPRPPPAEPTDHPTNHPAPHHPPPPTPHAPPPLPKLVDLKKPLRDCSSDHPCRKCEGDCDNDSHCKHHLVCFKKGRGEPGDKHVIPGCYGEDTSKSDWCVDPEFLD